MDRAIPLLVAVNGELAEPKDHAESLLTGAILGPKRYECLGFRCLVEACIYLAGYRKVGIELTGSQEHFATARASIAGCGESDFVSLDRHLLASFDQLDLADRSAARQGICSGMCPGPPLVPHYQWTHA